MPTGAPYRDPRSRSCCGAGDVVKTRFRVESGDDKYPDDRWYAWLTGQWIPIPPDKIVQDHAPDGQPYLFMAAGTVLRKADGRHMSFVVPSPLSCGPNALAIGRTFFTIATPDSHAAGQAISAAKEEF